VRRALVAAAAAGALLAPPASAHVTARPASLEARTTQRIFLEVPNERDAGTTTRVELAVRARRASICSGVSRPRVSRRSRSTSCSTVSSTASRSG
jgi:hypothetical protein